jgi:hypothetical protein
VEVAWAMDSAQPGCIQGERSWLNEQSEGSLRLGRGQAGYGREEISLHPAGLLC